MNGYQSLGKYASANVYRQAKGNFGVAHKVKDGFKSSGEFHSCREGFAPAFAANDKNPIVVAVDKSQTAELIFEFVARSEERLGIMPPSRLGYFENSKTVMGIEPSPWWVRNEVRRQFFTVLIRCALSYNGSNYFEALYNSGYTKTTRKAVDKFFDGFTSLTKNDSMHGGHGWLAVFQNNSHLDSLVKPRALKGE